MKKLVASRFLIDLTESKTVMSLGWASEEHDLVKFV